MYIKKTVDDMLNDSNARAMSQSFLIDKYDDETYSIYNRGTGGEYIVTIDSSTGEAIECTCPHFKYRLCSIAANYCVPCKHMIAVMEHIQYWEN